MDVNAKALLVRLLVLLVALQLGWNTLGHMEPILDTEVGSGKSPMGSGKSPKHNYGLFEPNFTHCSSFMKDYTDTPIPLPPFQKFVRLATSEKYPLKVTTSKDYPVEETSQEKVSTCEVQVFKDIIKDRKKLRTVAGYDVQRVVEHLVGLKLKEGKPGTTGIQARFWAPDRNRKAEELVKFKVRIKVDFAEFPYESGFFKYIDCMKKVNPDYKKAVQELDLLKPRIISGEIIEDRPVWRCFKYSLPSLPASATEWTRDRYTKDSHIQISNTKLDARLQTPNKKDFPVGYRQKDEGSLTTSSNEGNLHVDNSNGNGASLNRLPSSNKGVEQLGNTVPSLPFPHQTHPSSSLGYSIMKNSVWTPTAEVHQSLTRTVSSTTLGQDLSKLHDRVKRWSSKDSENGEGAQGNQHLYNSVWTPKVVDHQILRGPFPSTPFVYNSDWTPTRDEQQILRGESRIQDLHNSNGNAASLDSLPSSSKGENQP